MIEKNTKEAQHRNFLLEWNKANSQTTSEQQPSFTILYKQCFLREETKTTAPIHLSFHCICHTPGCLFSLSCPEESNDSSVYCVCSVCVQCVCVFSSPTIFLEEQWGGAQWWGCIAFVFSSFKSELVSGAEQLCDCVKFDSGCMCVFVCFLCNEIPSKHFYENRNFQCESILSGLCCLSIKISIIIL